MVKPPLRTKSIGFKVSQEEYAQLEAAARARGGTLGAGAAGGVGAAAKRETRSGACGICGSAPAAGERVGACGGGAEGALKGEDGHPATDIMILFSRAMEVVGGRRVQRTLHSECA